MQLELDSNGMEPWSSRHSHSLRHDSFRDLRMAMEEALDVFTWERGAGKELPDLEEPWSHSTDLLSLFHQKERDLVLAAKLGKALLDKNQDLTKKYEKMYKDNNRILGARKSRVTVANGESREWESHMAKLEMDIQQMQNELQRHQVQLIKTDRDRNEDHQ